MKTRCIQYYNSNHKPIYLRIIKKMQLLRLKLCRHLTYSEVKDHKIEYHVHNGMRNVKKKNENKKKYII